MYVIKPQKGKQEKFLASSADICIYGGAAGGGKSYAILLEALRHINNGKFAAVIFRKTNPQILAPGGIWDESFSIYSRLGAKPKLYPKPMWKFQSGATVTFSYLDMEQSKYDWQGSQIPLIMFDELTHFSESQFFYMMSRNRSTCGVKPYIRATCNPDADSWVAKLIEWWIDQETGYPIEERCSKVRWFIRRDELMFWADTRQELWEQFDLTTPEEKLEPRSLAFINSTLQDNKILLETAPTYMANLKALPTVERERLLFGNWKIKAAAGLYFKRTQIGSMLPFVPKDVIAYVRAWDLAATSENEKGDPAYTAGVLMGKRRDGRFIIIDVINVRQSAGDVRKTIKLTAMTDNAKYGNVKIRLPQDPGQAGKSQAQSFIKMLAGYSVKALPVTGTKESRAEPAAAQWQAGNFDIVVADWNEAYFSQLESFPASKFKDMVDATSDAFSELVQITERDKLIYPAFSVSENTYEEKTANKFNSRKYKRYISVNYSVANPMVFLEIIDDDNTVKVESEYFNSEKISDSAYAKDFEQFAGSPESVTFVILDENALTFKNELHGRGYRVKNFNNNDIRGDIAKVNAAFALNKLLINSECENLISELQSYIWDEKAAERGEEKPLKINDYACDALRCCVSSVIYNKWRFSNYGKEG